MEENNMSLVSFTSGINNIEENISLSEWAVKYIFSQKLTRDNHTFMDSFRTLSRSQKDAIRYQLRKGRVQTPASKKLKASEMKKKPPLTKPDILLFGKLALGAWISVFLLFDIAKIYITKGASPLVAWQAAVLVEICILSASLSLNSRLRKVAYALFAYNMLLFAVMEVDQILIKSSVLTVSKSGLVEKGERLKDLQIQLKEQLSENSKTLSRLASAHERGFITSGTLAFEKTSKTIQSNTDMLSSKITKLGNEIDYLTVNQHSIQWIYVSSLLYFLLRCILQLFAIRLLDRRN